MSFAPKIIFLVESPFNDRDRQRFGIDELQAQGIEVEVWDFSQALSRAPQTEQKFVGFHYLQFSEFSQALEKIEKSQAHFFVLLGYDFRRRKIFSALSKLDKSFGSLHLSSGPSINAHARTRSLWQRVLQWIKAPKQILHTFFYRTPAWIWGIRALNFYIVAGRKSLDQRYPINRKTQILWTHSFDFEQARDKPKFNSQKSSKFKIVFLDEYGPYHPDFNSENDSFGIAAEIYFTAIEKLFADYCNSFDAELVVLAHPRSDYSDKIYRYQKFPVLENKTWSEIQSADLVLAHASTAVQYAVLCKKPIHLLRAASQDHLREGLAIEALAKELGAPIVAIETSIALRKTEINEILYARYFEDHIKTKNSKDEPLWQNVGNYFLRAGAPK